MREYESNENEMAKIEWTLQNLYTQSLYPNNVDVEENLKLRQHLYLMFNVMVEMILD